MIAGLQREGFSRLTFDFDGSVLSTKGHAEGTAVGFNKAKKGARSYYPLFCTVAQTGQFFDVYHRPGNVHDSNGAPEFMLNCFEKAKAEIKNTIFESRMDSAFFNQDILSMLNGNKIKFTASVPFERFTQLKKMIEACTSWNKIDKEWSYFETQWKPKSWKASFRFFVYLLFFFTHLRMQTFAAIPKRLPIGLLDRSCQAFSAGVLYRSFGSDPIRYDPASF